MSGLQSYLLEMIRDRRSGEKKEERYDLFSSLLDANSQDCCCDQPALSDRELIGASLASLLARVVL
jgi:cytochrome P450